MYVQDSVIQKPTKHNIWVTFVSEKKICRVIQFISVRTMINHSEQSSIKYILINLN